MRKPLPTNWKMMQKRKSDYQKKFDAWLEEQYPSPKVIEERLENGMVIKKCEQDPRLAG